MPSGYEWLIVLGVIALLFGGAKLPKLARSLGSAKGEFEKGLKEGEKASKSVKDAPAAAEYTFAARADDAGWNEDERAALRATIAARQPFIDFVFHRVTADGKTRQFRVSGQPMFNESCRFLGYRGIGLEIVENE